MQEVGDVTPGLYSLHIPMALTASGLPESRPPGVHTASLGGCFDYAKAFDCVDHNKL